MNPRAEKGPLARLLPSREPIPALPSDRMDPRLILGLALSLLALHALLAWLGRPPGILTGQDNATYLTLARSLREGLGYRELYEVGQPLHTKYPPFYPAVLALWAGIFGESARSVAVLNIAASAGTLALVFFAVRRMTTPTAALACLAILAVNPFLVARPATAYSEPLYTLLSIAALWLAWSSSDRRTVLTAAGAAAILAALTRSIGVTLLAALILHWLLSRRWKASVTLTLVAGLTVGAWLGWTAMDPNQMVGSSYLADATFVPGAPGGGDGGEGGAASWVVQVMGVVVAVGRHMVENGATYAGQVLPWSLPMPTIAGTPVDNGIVLLALFPALLSGIFLLYRSWRAAALYLVAYGLLLSYWPWPHGRFLEPVLPLLVPAVVLGAAAIARSWLGRRAALAAGGLMVLAIGVAGAYRTIDFVRYRMECSDLDFRGGGEACLTEDQKSYFRALGWIREHAASDAVFLTAKPQPLYWHTGRSTVDDHTAANVDPSSFYPYLDEQGVDYVLLGGLRTFELSVYPDRLEAECERLKPIEHFPPRTWLFRLEPPADGGGVPTTIPDTVSRAAGCHVLDRFRELNEQVESDGSLLFYPSTAGPLLHL